MTTNTYPFLHDAAERQWLTEITATDVRDNAHRFYDLMAEAGMGVDSFLRELAFQKAAAQLGLDYDVLYDAWLNQTPVESCLHSWTAGMMSVHPEDAAEVNAERKQAGQDGVECAKCEAKLPADFDPHA